MNNLVLLGVLLQANATDGGWTIAETGQFGDTIGGLANVVTAIVAVISIIYAQQQVEISRDQHRREVRAEAVRRFWSSAHRHCRRLINLVNGSNTLQSHKDAAYDDARSTRDKFVDRMSDLRVLLPEATYAVIAKGDSMSSVMLSMRAGVAKDVADYRESIFKVLAPIAELADVPTAAESVVKEGSPKQP
jgi:hypothetical protein